MASSLGARMSQKPEGQRGKMSEQHQGMRSGAHSGEGMGWTVSKDLSSLPLLQPLIKGTESTEEHPQLMSSQSPKNQSF